LDASVERPVLHRLEVKSAATSSVVGGAGEPPVMRKTWRVTSEREADERRAAARRDLAGGRDAPVELVEYDDSWPGRFAAEAARLADVAPGVAWHHIGSTAVPGLAAKPIIDMMALVDDLDAPVRSLVDAGGYQYPEAYNATLVARRWLCRPSASRRTHHLHLVVDPEELARHLRFRDALRADSQLAAAYAALKRDLAGRMQTDREGYTAAKTAFITRTESGQRF
jgi:GrpB-like predicted nucleotidyltransferase (UPF0157 family)